MERHVHTRHRHVRTRGNRVCLLLQRSQTTLGAGDGVLLALDVVVHNLKELTGVLRKLGNVGLNLLRSYANHVRAQRTHTVVGVAVSVPRHQRAHCRATRVHNVNHSLQLKDVAQGGKRRVLTKRVACVIRARAQRVRLTQTLRLCVRHHSECNLRELGQVQHAVRVLELFAADDKVRRVFIHNALDGETVVGARVAVRTAPHLTCCCRRLAVALTHALGLDALARVDVGSLRLRQKRLAAGDHIAVNAAGHLKCLVDALAAHALCGDLHLIIQLHHAVHGVGPADHLPVAASQVLSGGRQPHAVHQRRLKVHQRRRVVGGVDRVVVTRN